jgi:carbon storage regulator
MLVLSRHKGEHIDIGSDIVVTVVEILDDKVRLGITAPKDVTVHRREITKLIAEQRREESA